jgi:hypothetical protein
MKRNLSRQIGVKIKYFLTLFIACLLFNLNLVAHSAPLIFANEAALPDGSVSVHTRGIVRGPGVDVISPDLNTSLKGPFNLKVDFKEHGGNLIDKNSIKVVYVKSPLIDLTSRFQNGISTKGLLFLGAEVPPGDHIIRISLKDIEGRETSKLITLKVKD